MGLRLVWLLSSSLVCLSAAESRTSHSQELFVTHARAETSTRLNFKRSSIQISKIKTAFGKNIKTEFVPLNVELALNDEEQQMGLMYRKSLATGSGMLFVFDEENQRQFWMKNTLIPLSIAFIDSKKTIIQIADLNPVKTLLQKTYDRAESLKPAKYVLEVPQGWFLVNKIGVGSVFSWPDEKKFIKK